MMDAFERFGIIINDHVVRTPVAIASMAGIVDAKYVLDRKAHAGVAFIGGYAIDSPTMDAAREIAAGGERKEFLNDNPVEALRAEIDLLKTSDVVTGINLRGSSLASFTSIADAFGDEVVYEIDAHCRQAPMVTAGAGEYYLKNPGALVAVVKALKAKGVTVSVKMRVGVVPDDRVLVRALWGAGADILHIDLMDAGIPKLRQIRNSCPLLIIANNTITTFDKMRDMLSHGADLVSLARQSDERTLAGLDAAITRYADEEGWYNSPKQLCPGRRSPGAHVLLHAGQGLPAHPGTLAHRALKGRVYPVKTGFRERHAARRRPPHLLWQPCMVLQDLIPLHVQGHDACTGRHTKERIYAPETRALRYLNEPCVP